MRQPDFTKLKRAEKTEIITKAVLRTLLIEGKGRRVGLPEINVNVSKGTPTLRIDVLEINRNSDYLIGYEVKSCISDFRADKKWGGYVKLVNKLYFVFDKVTYDKYKVEILKTLAGKAGIYIYSSTADWIYLETEPKPQITKHNKNIFRIMLFNYLLRTQIKESNTNGGQK